MNQAPDITVRESGDGYALVLDFRDEEAYYAWLKRSRGGSPIVRLEERIEEGSPVQVESRSGPQSDRFSAVVKQVFRSGADLWGTLLEIREAPPAELGEPNGSAQAEEERPRPVLAARASDGGAARVITSESKPIDLGGGVDATEHTATENTDAEDSDDSSEEVVTEEEGDEGSSGTRRGETYGASTFFELKSLNPNQRMMLATRANRQQRQLLLRDSSQPVQMALLSNPRLEPKEVVEIAKNPQSSGGVLQRLSNDQRFASNYEVQLALVRNPQTPSPIAVRLMEVMRTSDLRYLAKSQALRENVRKAALRVYLKRSP